MEARTWGRRKLGHIKRRARARVIPADRRYAQARLRLASQYLSGDGLEIGALHMPLRVPHKANVRYVDRSNVQELRVHYPELDGYDLVTPNIIDNGESLSTVPDESVDFVIANHMIEHCEDPIGTISNHLRVLRPGGVIYMAVPDCRRTFDHDRPVTRLEHLRRDYTEGTAWSRRGHYEEWARLGPGRVPEDQVQARASELDEQNYSIHFHVWTPDAFEDLLSACSAEFDLPLEIKEVEHNAHEFIVILGRT